MSANETLRTALFGSPPSDTYKPSREGVIAAFDELYELTVATIAAVSAGIYTVPTIADRDTFYSDVDNQGSLVYVNNNNDSATDPDNGVYEYVDGAARLAEAFYSGIASIVQPLVDDAETAATTAVAQAALTTAALTEAASPPLRPETYTNAVRNRYDSENGADAITIISGGNVTGTTLEIAWNEDLFDRSNEPACYRSAGTASAAGSGPRFSIPISVADLALIGLVPSDSSPPYFSVRAAFQLANLVNQTIDASVSGTTFLKGSWYVMLRYNGSGASLAGPNDNEHDVIFSGSVTTPIATALGNGDTVWDGSTGAQTLTADEKIMVRENVPLRATYGGNDLSGVILYFFGSATAAGATSCDMGRVALVAGATIDDNAAYKNLPEDAVNRVYSQNLDPALVSQIEAAATESPIAARITAVNGSNPASWALGMDYGWDFTSGLYYGDAATPSDTHAAAVRIKDQSGYYISVGANALARAEAVGLHVRPSRSELIGAPATWLSYYGTTAGTGSSTANRRGPDGVAAGAYTMTDSDGAVTYYRQRTETVANDSNSHTATIFLRKTRSTPTAFPSIYIGYVGGTSKNSRLVINPKTGETITQNSSNATWEVESAGEFWRISGTIANNTSGNTTFFHQIAPAYAASLTATASASVTGSNVFAWASIQKDTFATPPIPAGGTAGGNIVTASQSSGSGSAVAGFVTMDVRDPGATGVKLLSLDDGTANNYLAIEYVSGNAVLQLMSGGVEQAAVVIGQWRKGRQTIAFCAGTNYVWGQFLRGKAVTADTSATYPALNALGFGGNSVSTAVRRANVIIEKMAVRYGQADADTAAEMLERAEIAHGRAPIAWDAFDRTDNTDLGYAETGHEWLQLPGNGGARVESEIVSGEVIATPSGYTGVTTTAAYNTVLLRETASHIRTRVAFDAGTQGGTAALIFTKTHDDTSIVDWIVQDGAVHITFGIAQINVGIFLGGDNYNIAYVNYPTQLVADGSTEHEFGFDLDGNTITLHAPGLAPIQFTHERFLNLAGPYVTIENYWSDPAQVRPKFRYVEAW